MTLYENACFAYINALNILNKIYISIQPYCNAHEAKSVTNNL